MTFVETVVPVLFSSFLPWDNKLTMTEKCQKRGLLPFFLERVLKTTFLASYQIFYFIKSELKYTSINGDILPLKAGVSMRKVLVII